MRSGAAAYEDLEKIRIEIRQIEDATEQEQDRKR